MSCNCNCKGRDKDIFVPGAMACTSTGSCINRTVSCDCDDEQLIVVKGACSKEKLDGMLGVDDKTWTQIFIPEVLCVPHQKPDIEELMNVSVVADIFSQRVIKTPVLVNDSGEDVPIENEEGTILTGRKLVVEGLLRQKIIYTSKNLDQSVHSAHFDVPFSAFIILPKDTPLTQKYKIETCIEDIFICRITERQVFKNITLFIKATPLICSE